MPLHVRPSLIYSKYIAAVKSALCQCIWDTHSRSKRQFLEQAEKGDQTFMLIGYPDVPFMVSMPSTENGCKAHQCLLAPTEVSLKLNKVLL